MATGSRGPARRGHLLPVHALELVFQPQGPGTGDHQPSPVRQRQSETAFQPAGPQRPHPRRLAGDRAGRHARHAPRQLLLSDQYHDLGPALCHAGAGSEYCRGHRRAACAGLRGLLCRGRLYLRPAQSGLRHRLLGLSARGRLHGRSLRSGAGLPRAAPARRLPRHRHARLRRNRPSDPAQLGQPDRRLRRHQGHSRSRLLRHGHGHQHVHHVRLLHRAGGRHHHHRRDFPPEELPCGPCPAGPARRRNRL